MRAVPLANQLKQTDHLKILVKVCAEVKIGILTISGHKMAGSNQFKIVALNVNQHLAVMLLMYLVTMQDPKSTNAGYIKIKIQYPLLHWMEHVIKCLMVLMKV